MAPSAAARARDRVSIGDGALLPAWDAAPAVFFVRVAGAAAADRVVTPCPQVGSEQPGVDEMRPAHDGARIVLCLIAFVERKR